MKLTYIYSIVFAGAVLYPAKGTEKDQSETTQNAEKFQETQEPTIPIPTNETLSASVKKKRVSRSKVYYESGSFGKPLSRENRNTDQTY